MKAEDSPKENYEFDIIFQSKYILQVFRESFKERERETSSLTVQTIQ